jgi:hypothetical protein
VSIPPTSFVRGPWKNCSQIKLEKEIEYCQLGSLRSPGS